MPWPSAGHGPARRTAAAVLAALFTVMLLVLLQARPGPVPRPEPAPGFWILTSEAPAAATAPGAEAAESAPPPLRRDTPRRGDRPEPPRPATVDAAAIAETPTRPVPSGATPGESAQASAEPASAAQSLRLDAEVLRSAHRTSRSAVMQMAQRSEAYVGDEPVSVQERLAEDVAKAVKPECLGPGNSVLDAPVIAYRMLRESCRVR